MKPIHATLMAIAGLLALINSPLLAQDTPPATPPTEAQKPDETPKPSREVPRGKERSLHVRVREEEKPTPFIGVLTGEVPRELRAHAKLQEGFGLLVEEVMPDTPAQAAGIKVDDILVAFEDQKLVNMDQLQTLVRSKKKDDQVSLTVISAGQEARLTVKIDERVMPVRTGDNGRGDRFFQYGFFNDRDRGPEGMKEMRESMERYQDKMRDWARDGNRGAVPTPPMWSGPGRGEGDRSDRREGPSSRGGDRDRGSRNSRGDGDRGDHRIEHRDQRETTNVTRSDDSGIYSLRREGDRTIFTARPKDGQEQSWTLNTDQDRNAIPELMREKLRLLEEIRGGEKAMPPLPDPDSLEKGKPNSGPVEPKRPGI